LYQLKAVGTYILISLFIKARLPINDSGDKCLEPFGWLMIVKSADWFYWFNVGGQRRGAVHLFVHGATPEGQTFFWIPGVACECESLVDKFSSIVVGEHW